jgi:hypothetical protein
MISIALPLPHHRHATSSTDSSRTSTSSTVRSPPTEKWWNALVLRLVTTLNRVRLPQAEQRYRVSQARSPEAPASDFGEAVAVEDEADVDGDSLVTVTTVLSPVEGGTSPDFEHMFAIVLPWNRCDNNDASTTWGRHFTK